MQNATERILSANRVLIELPRDGKTISCEVPHDARSRLATWLGRASRDKNAKKYEIIGFIVLDPKMKEDWCILDINERELGLRFAADSYWRGLDREEFETIIKVCGGDEPQRRQ